MRVFKQFSHYRVVVYRGYTELVYREYTELVYREYTESYTSQCHGMSVYIVADILITL